MKLIKSMLRSFYYLRNWSKWKKMEIIFRLLPERKGCGKEM